MVILSINDAKGNLQFGSTLVVQNVFSVGQHTREYTAEEETAQTGPNEQEDIVGVED